MSRLTIRSIIALTTFGVGVALSALWLAPHFRPNEQRDPVAEVKVKVPETDGEIFSGPAVSYKGVSFSIDAALAASVKAEIKPASPLQDKTDKPDYVSPEHIAFTFIGPYASQHEQPAFTPPTIHIYPIDGYKRACAIEPHYVAWVDEVVQKLKQALAQQPTSFKEGVPYLDFIDAHQAFQAHVHYLNFQNGKGIIFLTQYVFEPTVISNQGLTYIFQGLTDDNKYYVSATFPISAPILPEEDNDELNSKYRLYDDACVTCNAAYLKGVSHKLEQLSAKQFQPKLTAFDDLLKSLRVQIVEASAHQSTQPN
jgi:hypothetical protein